MTYRLGIILKNICYNALIQDKVKLTYKLSITYKNIYILG